MKENEKKKKKKTQQPSMTVINNWQFGAETSQEISCFVNLQSFPNFMQIPEAPGHLAPFGISADSRRWK